MKTHALLVVLITSLALALPATAASSTHSAFGVGARYHPEHSAFDEVPYSDTFSYGVYYEYHEPNALWQLGFQYAPDLGNDADTIDYAITPELNLLWKDNVWRGGVGILSSYLESEDSGWSDIYWQFVLGFDFPVGALNLELMAYYVFGNWDDLGDFQFDDIDAGVFLGFGF